MLASLPLLLALSISSVRCQGRDTAAIVVGGHYDRTPTDSIGVNVPQVELFGCEVGGVRMQPVRLEDFPLEGIWLPAGTLLPGEDRVMVCGGFTCDGGTCSGPPSNRVSSN